MPTMFNPTMSEEKINDGSIVLIESYQNDLSHELTDELNHHKAIHAENIGEKLSPLALLNKLHSMKVNVLFPNVCIALRIFCTIPVTVASAEPEQAFSRLARIKNVMRATMDQERLSSLGVLAIEANIARSLIF